MWNLGLQFSPQETTNNRLFFFFFSWRLITLQYCSGFCHTLTRISHGFTCIPHPDPPLPPPSPQIVPIVMAKDTWTNIAIKCLYKRELPTWKLSLLVNIFSSLQWDKGPSPTQLHSYFAVWDVTSSVLQLGPPKAENQDGAVRMLRDKAVGWREVLSRNF